MGKTKENSKGISDVAVAWMAQGDSQIWEKMAQVPSFDFAYCAITTIRRSGTSLGLKVMGERIRDLRSDGTCKGEVRDR